MGTTYFIFISRYNATMETKGWKCDSMYIFYSSVAISIEMKVKMLVNMPQ